MLEFAPRHVDALANVDAAKLIEREFLANAGPEVLVVDALSGEELGHVAKRNTLFLGNAGNHVVQDLVRDLEADSLRALQLDLLDDQPLENLLLQYVRRRQWNILLLRTRDDRRRLVAELAAHDDAFVDDGRHAVEKLARLGEVLGKGRRRSRNQGNCR